MSRRENVTRASEVVAWESWACTADGAAVCSRPRVLGEAFCARHLPTSAASAEAVRRCSYVSNRSSRRCVEGVGKGAGGKEGLCPHHALLVTRVRRAAARKTQLRETPEVIAENLAHYAKFAADQGRLPKPDSVSSIQAQNRTRLHRARLDYFSDASSESEDGERPVALHRLNQPHLPPPTHPEDPLRNAGVLTAEEVVRISRDKLLRLQLLYTDYLGVLEQRMRLSLQRERVRGKEAAEAAGGWGEAGWSEGGGGGEGETGEWRREGGGPSSGYTEARRRERLNALKRYGRCSRREAVVSGRAVRERRGRAGLAVPGAGERRECQEEACDDDALPSSSFCLKHILHQHSQLLFAECLTPECTTPVAPFAAIRHCWLHRPIPTSPTWPMPSPAPTQPPASQAPQTVSLAPLPILPPTSPTLSSAPILSPSAAIPPPQPSSSHKRKHSNATASDDVNDTINVLNLDVD